MNQFSRVPLFVSYRSMRDRKSLKGTVAQFALDSGGFTELQKYGEWKTTEGDYVAFVARLRREVGHRLQWVAPMDWMCEPVVLAGGRGFVGTGLDVLTHQRNTIANFLRLRARLGDTVVPVLQGWELSEYLQCAQMYEAAGVDLGRERLVAVGSTCRRTGLEKVVELIHALASRGLRLHPFGLKTTALSKVASVVQSTDSMAWSMAGRHRPNRDHEHMKRSLQPGQARTSGAAKNCANCKQYALEWYGAQVAAVSNALAVELDPLHGTRPRGYQYEFQW